MQLLELFFMEGTSTSNSLNLMITSLLVAALVDSNRLSEIASRTVLCIEAGDALVTFSLSLVL